MSATLTSNLRFLRPDDVVYAEHEPVVFSGTGESRDCLAGPSAPMIVWLASYPRSGNTLLRLMLHTVFGQVTYSKYDDRLDIGADARLAAAVGHAALPRPWADAYRLFSADPGLRFIKTHDAPEDDARAIYVVRDGLAAARSYWHYLHDFTSTDCALEAVIAGLNDFGSWGLHLDRWEVRQRPETLLVRFEDLLHAPELVVERLAAFCTLEPQRRWANPFDTLHAAHPRFFRRGAADQSPDHESARAADLVAALHGDWMAHFGYTAAAPGGARQPLVRDLIARLWAEQQGTAHRAQVTQQKLDRLQARTWTRLGKVLRAIPREGAS